MKPPTEPIPISVVAHHAFCSRRAWLEVHGERTDTAQMAIGVAEHQSVDDPATTRTQRIRAVEVSSRELGVRGRCDTVEIDEDGKATIVEHKATPIRRSTRVSEPQRIQLALQALCLQEQGHEVAGAAIWFSTQRRRVQVELDHLLLQRARAETATARDVIQSSTPPDPLEDDPRCRRCSQVAVCLPDEHRRRTPARRIGVSNPTGRILHLASPGSCARLRRGQILVETSEHGPATVPIGQIAGLVVHGNADVSSALVREILERGHAIVWCQWSGRVTGWAIPAGGPNAEARARQHRLSDRERHQTARAIVAAKINNQATLLRRHRSESRVILRELARRATESTDASSLLGLEGRAAATYFPALDKALAPGWAQIPRRTSRPAPDPVNAALNLAYSLLLADVLRAIVACGLDPAGGVLHSAGRNKPALALDLMEELRAPVADSAVLWAINNGELRERDFRRDIGAVRLTPGGRKALIGAYERRASAEFRHPQFGYRVSWRRAMEVQARMFLALVLNETNDYRPIETR